MRVLKNPMAREYIRLSDEGATREELEKLTLGSLKRAVNDGDLENGSFMAGQVAGLIKEIKPVKQIISDLFSDLDKLISEIKVL